MKKLACITTVLLSFFVFANVATASGKELTDKEASEQVFGWEIMSIEERAAHRSKMRSLKSEEELEAYRKEHHERMQARAKEKGLTLPDKPMMRGSGRMMMDSD